MKESAGNGKKTALVTVLTVLLIVVLSATCEPVVNCPDCVCKNDTVIIHKDTIFLPAIYLKCNDTVIVKGYAFKDYAGNLYTDNPLAMLMQQQHWILQEQDKNTKALQQLYNKIMNVNEHIIYLKIHDTIYIDTTQHE